MKTVLPAKTYGTGQKIILSVEDDQAAFHLMTVGFNEVGGDFQLYHVEDGREALHFLRRSGRYPNAPKPNLVLLNLNLPRITGLEVLQEVKNDPMIQDIPVVIFSSSDMDKDKAKCLAIGARKFITKPVGLDDFIKAIRDVCLLI